MKMKKEKYIDYAKSVIIEQLMILEFTLPVVYLYSLLEDIAYRGKELTLEQSIYQSTSAICIYFAVFYTFKIIGFKH